MPSDRQVRRIDPEAVLPESIPVRTAAPLQPRRLGFVVGALGLWLAPARAGAHLGAVRWHTALIVAILGSALSAWLIGSAVAGPAYDKGHYDHRASLTIGERLRIGPAQAVLAAMSRYSDEAAAIAVGLAAPAALAAAILLLALASVPFADAGERLPRLLARCVKINCWLMTLGIPVGLVLLAAQHLLETSGYYADRFDYPDWRQYEELVRHTAYAVAGLWAISVWLRAMSGYAGPAEGPGWAPLAPRCVGCGYILTGLSPAGLCPECGRPAADGLPDSRSRVLWQRARFLPVRLIAFVATVASVLFGPKYFERMPVRGHRASALWFWLCNWVLLSVVFAPLLIWIYQSDDTGRAWSGILRKYLGLEQERWSEWGERLSASVHLAAFLALSLRLLAAQAAVSTVYYWVTVRDRPCNSTVALYLPALLWPVAAALTAAAAGLSRFFQGQAYGFAIAAGAAVTGAAAIVWSIHRVADIRRATRYATA